MTTIPTKSLPNLFGNDFGDAFYEFELFSPHLVRVTTSCVVTTTFRTGLAIVNPSNLNHHFCGNINRTDQHCPNSSVISCSLSKGKYGLLIDGAESYPDLNFSLKLICSKRMVFRGTFSFLRVRCREMKPNFRTLSLSLNHKCIWVCFVSVARKHWLPTISPLISTPTSSITTKIFSLTMVRGSR
jgi:hypothetical protein